MNLKVTIEIDGTLYTKEGVPEEQSVFTDVAVLDALQDILVDAGIISKGDKLDVIDSDQSKILDQAGY
jgi:hypothetical protein|tara:strand:- start:610 stop:813 length:204 start_codon:yes stop_codon:yes gene_type:complete